MHSHDAVTHVGTRELRANLAAHLRAAQAGHRVVVTVDGSPVAELGPVDSTPSSPRGCSRHRGAPIVRQHPRPPPCPPA
jgi:prevent-host-death family protein